MYIPPNQLVVPDSHSLQCTVLVHLSAVELCDLGSSQYEIHAVTGQGRYPYSDYSSLPSCEPPIQSCARRRIDGSTFPRSSPLYHPHVRTNVYLFPCRILLGANLYTRFCRRGVSPAISCPINLHIVI